MSIVGVVDELDGLTDHPSDADILEERAQLLARVYADQILQHTPGNVPAWQFIMIIAALTARFIRRQSTPAGRHRTVDLVCERIRQLAVD